MAGFQTIDGVTLATSDANLRVLVKNQTDQTDNGVYDAQSGNWTRAVDFDGNGDFVNGTRIYVNDGSTASGEYEVTSADPHTVGTSNITFDYSFSGVSSAVTAAYYSSIAGQYATSAGGYRDQALAASEASGNVMFYDTKADANAALSGLSANQVIEVFADESRNGDRTRYRKESGVYDWKVTLSPNFAYSVLEYGALGNGVADDGAEIQAALDAAGAAGGGSVYLPPGTYIIDQVLSVPANVKFFGAGMNVSILRMKDASISNKVINGVAHNAAVVLLSGSTVSDLCVDLRTNSCLTDGIQVGEYGQSSRPSGAIIERNKVLGFDAHIYLIYVKLADRVHIRDNLCEATTSSTAPSQDVPGCEVFGCEDVVVDGNTFVRCNQGIILKSQAGISGSYVRRARVTNNRVETVVSGIVTSSTTGGDINDVVISGNTINDVQTSNSRAIWLVVAGSSTTRNVVVSGNVCQRSARTLIDVAGLSGCTMSGITITGNSLYSSDDCDTYMNISYGDGVLVDGNNMSGGSSTGAFYGISMNASTKIDILRNKMTFARRRAVQIQDACTYITIDSNTFHNFSAVATADPCILADATTPSSYLFITQNRMFPNTPDLGVLVSTATAQYGACLDNIVNFTRTTNLYDLHSSTRARQLVSAAPASESDIGDRGDYFSNSSYKYECTAASTWRRVAHAGGF